MSNILNVNKRKILNVLTENELSIPIYQRSYSWDRQNVEALISDIESRALDNSEHFFGTIALAHEGGTNENGKERLRVIDGQQRLTTCLIVYTTLLRLLKKSNDSGAREYKRKLSEVERLNLRHELSESELNDNLNYLAHGNTEDLVDKFKENYETILNYYKNFSLEELEKNLQAIEERFFVSVVMFKVDRKNEMVIFETLNSRGAPLTDFDLIKNHLISICTEIDRNGQESDVYKRNHRMFNRNIYNKQLFTQNGLEDSTKAFEMKMDEFFAAYTSYKMVKLGLKPEKIGPYPIFRNLKKVVDKINLESYEKYNATLMEMKSLLQIFVKLETAEKNVKSVWLGVLSKKNTHYPLVFGLYKKYAEYSRSSNTWTEPEILESYFMLMAFYWLKLASVKGTGQSLLNFWLEILREAERDEPVSSIYASLTKKKGNEYEIPTDGEFELSLQGSPRAAWIPKALAGVLDKIAEERAGMRESVHIEKTSLEHIMPKKPAKSDWPDVDPSTEEFKKTIDQIGNLALLNGSVNSSFSNSSFKKKKEGYINSKTPLLTGDGLEMPHICTYDTFGYKEIKERTKVLTRVLLDYFNEQLNS